MNQDQQTYQRATTAALVGFATHVVLTLFIAILGVYAGSPAFHAVTWYLLPGLAIWAVLWLLFNQHRHERAESLEAARLADSDAASAAIFDQAGAQLAQSRTRLGNLYKWGLPIVSGFTAVYMMGLGAFLLYRNLPALKDGGLFENPANPALNVALVALLLVICWLMGFLVARYVAGMTRIDAWQGLRGGASFLIGNVFLGVLPLLLGTIGLAIGVKSVLAVLAVAIPVVMILLGIEIVLAFVFGLYRPRKADEFVRPAFDSRVLGWLTRPESMGKIFSETLNYQFGFEISRSWFMQLLSKALVPLCVVCVLIVVGMSSIVIVEPHQQAVITTNGAFTKIADPGLSFKLPWPVSRATKYDVNRVHTLRLGSRAHVEEIIDGPILWSNTHVGEGAKEQHLVTAPTPLAGEAGETDSALGEMLGADIDIKFRITDLQQYLGISNPQTSAQDPEALLRAIAEQQVTHFFATHDTQTLLTTGRLTAGEIIQARIQSQLNTYEVGLEVVFVSVSGVHPPQEVAEDYHKRVNALQERQTTIQQALQEAAVTLVTVAGSREAALEIANEIRQYNALESEAQTLRNADDPDAQRLVELEGLIAEKRATVELLLLESGGESGQRIMQARADRWSLSLDAQARALRRQSEILAFQNAPRYYPMRRYLDMLTATMSDRPKIFILPAPDAEPPNVVIEMPQPAIGGAGR